MMYDISVDMGEGKDWWHVHGLTTHDKVYELNRQMCDLGKTTNDPMKPLSEETSQETIKTLEDYRKSLEAELKACEIMSLICEDIEKSIKSDDMEKKTKKMTKAEAFEYLKDTKVKCYERSNALYCELVEKISTECGCIYDGFMSPPDVSVFAIRIDDAGYIGHLCTVNADKYNELKCREISAEDILSIEIVEEQSEDNIAEKNAFLQARDIMRWLREKQSPHTLMIIDGNHVELFDGVKSEVWEE